MGCGPLGGFIVPSESVSGDFSLLPKVIPSEQFATVSSFRSGFVGVISFGGKVTNLGGILQDSAKVFLVFRLLGRRALN